MKKSNLTSSLLILILIISPLAFAKSYSKVQIHFMSDSSFSKHMISLYSCGLLAQNAGYSDDARELSRLANKDLKRKKCDGGGHSKAECDRKIKRYTERKIIPIVVDDLAKRERYRQSDMSLKEYSEIQYARRCNYVH